MKKNLIICFIVCALVLALGVSSGSATDMLVPFEVEGAPSVVQYRSRVQQRYTSETPTVFPLWTFISREYGEWGEWSGWSTSPAAGSDLCEAETREGEGGNTEYRFRTRGYLYTFGKWGDWSAWSDEAVRESETRQVETRVLSVVSVPDTAVDIRTAGRVYMLTGTGTGLFLSDSPGSVVWQSDDPSVAAVDASGYVSACSAGQTVVRAKNEYGISYGSLTLHVIGAAAVLPEGMEVIEEEAYAETALKAVDLRNTRLSRIGPNAFRDCVNLRLVVTDGLSARIEDDAFGDLAGVSFAAAGEDSAFLFAENNGMTRYIYGPVRPFVPVGGIRLTGGLTMNLGESVRLSAEISPADATLPFVTWSADSDAVRVDEYGLVTALRPGTAVVAASTPDGRVSAECAVTVTSVPVTAVRLDRSDLVLEAGSTARLTAVTEPAGATDPSVVWSSDDPGTVSVIDGLVAANEPGVATVYAVSHDENRIFASCRVTVLSADILLEEAFVNMAAEDITDTDATLSTELVVDENPVMVGFSIGTEEDQLENAAAEVVTGLGETLITRLGYTMSSWNRTLSAGTTYYYSFWLEYEDRTVVSPVRSFRTCDAAGPGSDGAISAKGSVYGELQDDGFILNSALSVTSSEFNLGVTCSLPANVEHVGCILSSGGRQKNIPFLYLSSVHDFSRVGFSFTASLEGMNEIGSTFEYKVYYIADDIQHYSTTLSFTRPESAEIHFFPFEMYCYENTTDVTYAGVPFTGGNIRNCSFAYSEASLVQARYDRDNRVIYFSSLGRRGSTLMKITAEVGSETLSLSIRFRVLSKPSVGPPKPPKVRLAAVANVSYNKIDLNKSKWTSLYDYVFENADRFGNIYTPRGNVDKITAEYRRTSYVGKDNVKKTEDPGTTEKFKSFIFSALGGAADGDISIIYVAGHGHYDGRYASVLTGNNQGVWEYDWLDIANMIKGTKIFIVDTCHSGALVRYFRRLGRKDVCVLSASRIPLELDPDRSKTHSMPMNRLSYLAYYFLDGISWNQGVMGADRKKRDNKITVTELFEYIAEKVSYDTANPDPFGWEEKYTIRPQDPDYYIPSGCENVVIFQRANYE